MGKLQLGSEAHLALLNSRWFLKIRATYPKLFQSEARSHIQELATELGFSEAPGK